MFRSVWVRIPKPKCSKLSVPTESIGFYCRHCQKTAISAVPRRRPGWSAEIMGPRKRAGLTQENIHPVRSCQTRRGVARNHVGWIGLWTRAYYRLMGRYSHIWIRAGLDVAARFLQAHRGRMRQTCLTCSRSALPCNCMTFPIPRAGRWPTQVLRTPFSMMADLKIFSTYPAPRLTRISPECGFHLVLLSTTGLGLFGVMYVAFLSSLSS